MVSFLRSMACDLINSRFPVVRGNVSPCLLVWKTPLIGTISMHLCTDKSVEYDTPEVSCLGRIDIICTVRDWYLAEVLANHREGSGELPDSRLAPRGHFSPISLSSLQFSTLAALGSGSILPRHRPLSSTVASVLIGVDEEIRTLTCIAQRLSWLFLNCGQDRDECCRLWVSCFDYIRYMTQRM